MRIKVISIISAKIRFSRQVERWNQPLLSTLTLCTQQLITDNPRVHPSPVLPSCIIPRTGALVAVQDPLLLRRDAI